MSVTQVRFGSAAVKFRWTWSSWAAGPDLPLSRPLRRGGQVGVLQIALADRFGEPLVVGLGREAEHPAGQPHREVLGGRVTDQRVDHFGSVEDAK
jgi:hypothetical protein